MQNIGTSNWTKLGLRTGYFADRSSFLALVDLLREIFGIDIGLLDRFGGPDPDAMPFGYFDAEGRCVANFSAFPMPLLIDGRPTRAVGYQSGAVRPDYRGRGLYRDLMRRAFDWSDSQGFELGLLLTDKPDLYAQYGFRSVVQHLFRGPMPAVSAQVNARPLSLEADLTLVAAMLEARADVSKRFALRGATRTFLLNASFDQDIRLAHLPALEALVAWKLEDATLRLLDIAARTMPRLDAVLASLGASADTVEVLFPPDLLDWHGKPVRQQGDCDLMARIGPHAEMPIGPFMLSPTMDF